MSLHCSTYTKVSLSFSTDYSFSSNGFDENVCV